MKIEKLKICWMIVSVAALSAMIGLSGDSSRCAAQGGEAGVAPVRTAGYGGVLVPKRVRIVIGFVQTLPA